VAAKGKVSKNFDFIGINPPMFPARKLGALFRGKCFVNRSGNSRIQAPARLRSLLSKAEQRWQSHLSTLVMVLITFNAILLAGE